MSEIQSRKTERERESVRIVVNKERQRQIDSLKDREAEDKRVLEDARVLGGCAFCRLCTTEGCARVLKEVRVSEKIMLQTL